MKADKNEPEVPLVTAAGIFMLLVALFLGFMGMTLDTTVAVEATGALGLPERVNNLERLATREGIVLVACALFVSGWVAIAAGHVGSAIRKASMPSGLRVEKPLVDGLDIDPLAKNDAHVVADH